MSPSQRHSHSTGCPCSLPTHPSILEMNVAMASSKVNLSMSTVPGSTMANTTLNTASRFERTRTVSPTRSSTRSSTASPTRTTTSSPPSSSPRSSLDRLRASPGANLLAGGVGGLASLVVGHPFDTVKVIIICWMDRSIWSTLRIRFLSTIFDPNCMSEGPSPNNVCRLQRKGSI